MAHQYLPKMFIAPSKTLCCPPSPSPYILNVSLRRDLVRTDLRTDLITDLFLEKNPRCKFFTNGYF